METHPLRGNIFETLIISELIKSQLNRGERPAFYFWRDSNGNEVDLIVEQGTSLMPVEIKYGKTLTRDSFAGLDKWCTLAGDKAMTPTLVYGGSETYRHKETRVIGWQKSGEVFENGFGLDFILDKSYPFFISIFPVKFGFVT